MKKRLIDYLAVCSFFLIFLVLGLIVVEFFFRGTSPFRNVPPKDQLINGIKYTFGHPIFPNQFGYREREFIVPKPPGIFRVMVLGDSFTYGYGLDAEDAYTRVAENILRGKLGPSVEVLNFSLPGYSTLVEAEILKKYIEMVAPDLIVIGFCFNDPLMPAADDYVESGKTAFSEKYSYAFDFANGIAVLGFREIGRRVSEAINTWGDRNQLQPTWLTPIEHAYQTNSQEWKSFQFALREIKSISDERGLKGPLFAVLNQGASHTEPPDYDHPSALLHKFINFWDQAENAASDAGYVAYNHLPEIEMKLAGQYLGINSVDWHPSKNLHQVYGEKLADKILSSGAIH